MYLHRHHGHRLCEGFILRGAGCTAFSRHRLNLGFLRCFSVLLSFPFCQNKQSRVKRKQLTTTTATPFLFSMCCKHSFLPLLTVSWSIMPPSAKPSRSSSLTFSQGMYVTPRSTSQNCLYSCFTPLLRAQAIYTHTESVFETLTHFILNTF